MTDEEVDALWTTRADGVSMAVLAEQHRVNRVTVWAKTGLARQADGPVTLSASNFGR
jgi:hypothetical protein